MQNNKQKPVYYFIGKARFTYWSDTDRQVAHLELEDVHPCGDNYVRTSAVLYKFDDGSFETMNSIYVPIANKANKANKANV